MIALMKCPQLKEPGGVAGTFARHIILLVATESGGTGASDIDQVFDMRLASRLEYA
jgi:hypothetical protein